MIYDGASYRINIEGADSTIIVDSWTNTIKANIASSTGEVLLDEQTGTFQGKFKGDLLTNDGRPVFDANSNQFTADAFNGNIKDIFGNIVFDYEASRLHGALVGHLYNDNGELVANTDTKTWHGNLNGNIVDAQGNIVFDADTATISYDIVSNIYNSEGHIAFDKDTTTFTGTFVGNFVGSNGNTIYDSETNRFEGQFHGPLIGDIVNLSGATVFNSNSGEFHIPVNGTFSGDLLGNLVNEIGETVYNHSSDHLRVKTADFGTADGAFTGTFAGDLLNPLTGEVKYDSSMGHFHNVSMTGYLYSSAGAEVFNPDQNVLSSKSLFSQNIVCSHFDCDSTQISNEGIFLNIESNFSQPAIEAKFYRETPSNIPDWFQQGIELCGVGGSWMAPKAVTPGHSLPALTWNAVISVGEDPEDSSYDGSTLQATSLNTKAVVAYIGARVPEDSTFDIEQDIRGACGELVFVTNNHETGVNYMTYDQHGRLHTTLAEINTEGETGVTPSNTATPDSWLKITVNGETKFLPLYS